jgi:sterol desaturase/sphingolipid hydroxylase (fatty acid hydroxylase superfamily)
MKPKNEEVTKPVASPDLDLIGHLTSFAAAVRSFLLATLCVYYAYPAGDYPAFGPARELSFAWMWPIILRDIVGTWVICGFWDWFLYFSPLKEKLHKYRIESKYPPVSQMRHDLVMSTCASITGAFVEIALCYCWANNILSFQHKLSDNWPITIFWAMTITHLRIPHFWMIHRVMHPWKTKTIPDVGKFLYRHVHSLHHKSINTTSFSGTNMHPVESTLYYSAAVIPALLGAPPVIAVAYILDCAVGAWLGHDGFQWPGSGDYFHHLHHAHFDCNFGAMHFPMDKWLGTYASCGADVRKIWKKDSKQ